MTLVIDRPVPLPPLDFQAFVIVARPPRDNDEAAVRRRYGFVPSAEQESPVDVRYACVERVLLPRGRDCCFCEEREVLERRRERLSGSHDVVDDRIEHVTTGPAGLSRTLFLGGTEGDRPTVGSFFGHLSPVTAFAAAASVAQTQRHAFASTRRAATVHVLDTPLVSDAYFDAVLAGGVLRTFDARDLRNPGQDLEFNAKLEDRAEEFARGSIMEIAWAAALHKLPSDGVRYQLAQRAPHDPLAQAMLDLLDAS